MALVRFLLIIFIIFFLVRVIVRFIFRSYVRNVQQNFENQQNHKKEGDVTINTKPKAGKKIDKDEGDYVDFEEIKE
jgi:large-conductance mechanosensitive channel